HLRHQVLRRQNLQVLGGSLACALALGAKGSLRNDRHKDRHRGEQRKEIPEFSHRGIIPSVQQMPSLNRGLTVTLQSRILAIACDRAPPARGKGTNPTCFDSRLRALNLLSACISGS